MSAQRTITLVCHAKRVGALLRHKTSSIDNARQLRNLAAPLTQLSRSFVTEKSAEKEQQSDVEAVTGNSESSLEAIKKLEQDVETLTNEIKTLKEKNETLTDKYKRSLADSENLRVRLTKQISDAKIFGIQSFCKDLLEVADTLGHATNSVPPEALEEENLHLKNLYEGLTMTKASLLQVFKRHGLEAINPINEKFDPNMHEALFQKDDPNAEPNTVVEVTKLGYKLRERCIRPALVGVSKS